MTIEEAQYQLARLKVAYPQSKPFDDLGSDVYTETLVKMNVEDFKAASIDLIQSLKFFPSIAEIIEAVDFCKGRRLQWDEHQSREKRLSAAQNAIMDPKAPIHQRVVGPEHARFLRLIRGEEKFPEPEWMNMRACDSPRAASDRVESVAAILRDDGLLEEGR